MEYDRTMEIAAENINDITGALVGAGFEKDSLQDDGLQSADGL